MAYRIGVDIGGTFIDFCFFDEASNDLHTLKVLTTPGQPGAEVLCGMRIMEQRHGISSDQIRGFIHGTTVGVNTVIQRKGARLALLTTEHFEDVLELARLRMPETYSLLSTRPEPLVTKDRVFPVRERMRADGTVSRPLESDSVLDALARARARGAEGIVIALLHSYRNPAHELEAKQIIEQADPELPVFCSSEVWPVIREYERTTTAVINGYVHPRVSGYLSSLQQALREHGVHAEALITKSNGGVMSADLGKTACVNMLLSGTASGVIGGAFVAGHAGVHNAITLDIGGTSADVALVIDGAPQYGTGEMVGEFPLYVPAVSVNSIGDGGGSIAWVDGFGVLKVGPESAGSDPGPACYGHGGTRATITDAFAVCGYLGHHALAYDSVALDVERARAAVGAVADKLGRDLHQSAEAIIRVAVSGMFMEINKLVARHGIDPRDFALVTFGGAGPMLGPLLARELGMPRVLVPLVPGVVSALGALVADVRSDFIKTIFLVLDDDAVPALQRAWQALREQALAWLHEVQGFAGEHTIELSADMNYKGQSFELEVDLDEAWVRDGDLESARAAFHREHESIYDFCDRDAEVHVMNLRMVIAGVSAKPQLKPIAPAHGPAEPERHIEVFLGGTWRDVPLYERAQLCAGHRLRGPAVVAQSDTTTVIPDAIDVTVDRFGNLMLEHAG
jgi:N-methylhydantoinase A